MSKNRAKNESIYRLEHLTDFYFVYVKIARNS